MRHVGIVTDDALVRYYIELIGVSKVCFVSTVTIKQYQDDCRYFDDNDVYDALNQILAEHLGLTSGEIIK